MPLLLMLLLLWHTPAEHSRVTWYIHLYTDKCTVIVQELCENRGGRPDEPSGFRGRKELSNCASALVTVCS